MARDIVCDLCHQENAMALYSTIGDGTTIAIGEACSPQFVIGLAIAVGVLPDPSVEPEPTPKRTPAKGRRKPTEDTEDDAQSDADAPEAVPAPQ